MHNNLTAKQEKFCQGIVSGLTATDSYRQAYNTSNMSKQAVWNEASQLMKRDDITARIKELNKPLVNHYENTVIRDSERIREELWAIIRDTTGEKTENRIRAMDMLNRMNQAYKDDTADTDKTDSIDQLDTDKLIQLVNTA